MPINYETLKYSEVNLKQMLIDFYAHVLKSETKLLNLLKKHKRLTDKQFDELFALEKQSNKWEAKILDEASWVISKDMPRAAHLRFIIAVIRSIRDLERLGDYVINVARYLYRVKKPNPKIWSILAKTLQEALIILKDVYNNLVSGNKQNKAYYSHVLIPLQDKFTKKYRLIFKQLGQIIFKAKNMDDALGAFTAIKNIERSVDHAVNIEENFVFISEANFYFTKETRKIKTGKK